MADAPHPDEETGLYAKHEDGKHELKSFTVSQACTTSLMVATDYHRQDGFLGVQTFATTHRPSKI